MHRAVTEQRRGDGDASDNVLRVRFGRSRDASAKGPDAEPPRVRERFTREDLAKLLEVNPLELRRWERAGLLRALRHGEEYGFAEVVAARAARALLSQGVPLGRIRRALRALRSWPAGWPGGPVRLQAVGRRVLLRWEGSSVDPLTGQLELPFDAPVAPAAPVVSLPRRPVDGLTAQECFLEGCRLDVDENTRAAAERAYRRALALEPGHSGAATNLGTLLLAKGDLAGAEELFVRAAAFDPSQCEAVYNLAWVLLQRDEHERALPLLFRAVALEPTFADAHFNLAATLGALGHLGQARAHFDAYLALAPEGPFAREARERLDALPKRVRS